MKLATLIPIIQKIDMECGETETAYSSVEYATRIIEEIDQLPERYVFIGVPELDVQDSGVSETLEIIDEDELDEEVGPYIRVMSWDPDKRHVAIKPFKDTKVRVTLELE